MVDRQVRYNVRTDTGEQEAARHRWVFLVINESREVLRIKERIWHALQPIADLDEIASGLIISSGGLHYNYFAFSSSLGEIDEPSKIYSSRKLKCDRNLVEKNHAGCEDYIKRIKSRKA